MRLGAVVVLVDVEGFVDFVDDFEELLGLE